MQKYSIEQYFYLVEEMINKYGNSFKDSKDIEIIKDLCKKKIINHIKDLFIKTELNNFSWSDSSGNSINLNSDNLKNLYLFSLNSLYSIYLSLEKEYINIANNKGELI